MKILTVVYNLEKGGTQRAAQVFAEAYNKLGHDSKVLSLYGLGIRYYEIKNFLKVWHKLSNKNLNSICEWKPDIIHIHSHGPKKEDIEKLINVLPTANIVETNVFSIPSQWANKVNISFQLSNWAQWIFNLRGGHKYQSVVLPNPVKCNAFKRARKSEIYTFKKIYKIPKEAFVIGRIGQAFSGKWSPMLIRAFNNLAKKESNYYLLLINSPENIVKITKESPYKNRIIHISKILGDRNLSVVYSSMDVMVHIAEQGESFGMVLAEAILCETPVITLSTPWADNSQCEVVGNLVGGYVVNSFDGLKRAIISFSSDNQDQVNFKKCGKEHIYNEYDYLFVAERAINLFKLKKTNNKIDNSRILEILTNTFDQPKWLTTLFIKFNNNHFRALTKYSSNYDNWYNVIMKILNKIKKIIKGEK